MTDSDPSDTQGRSEQGVIERLYDVAVDPSRYEELLDQWEALIAPQRLAANLSSSPALGLDQLAGHVQRADQVLDRVIRSGDADTPAALLARIDRNAAFAVDGSLTAVAVNTAASSVLGITQGAPVADLALAADEGPALARQIDRLLRSNSAIPVVLRSRAARTDRIIVFTLRVVRPETAAPFVLAISSELIWPPGFGEMLRNAFDLTQAEAEVMQALAEGQPLVQIAEQRSRSVETVRAQLKSLMSKTETRSQAELVRLTLSTMEMALF
jgi:DNA-binding CsgD family transcriptional regulator